MPGIIFLINWRAAMIDLLRAAARREFRSFIHLRFLLVLLSPLSFASDALAQFSVEGGRSDRPMGRMERGGGMRDEGIGIGIGIGIEIGKTAAERAARENPKKVGGGTTTGPSERAARKGDKPGKEKKGDAKKNNEDAPPTAFPKDPAEGIDVPGGKVHRGTGTVTGYKGGPRPGIYCWVHLTDKTKCEKTAQYQFVTVNIEAKWGDGTKANINDAVKKLRENHGKALPTTANGVSVVPGQTVGDDYNDTRHQDPANLTDDNGNKVKDPNGKEIKAGPYNPQKIPGGGGDTGLIDAPHWSDTVSGLSGGLVPKSLGTQSKKQPAQPAPSAPGRERRAS